MQTRPWPCTAKPPGNTLSTLHPDFMKKWMRTQDTAPSTSSSTSKFKHLQQSTESDKFVVTDDPDVISFVPILQSLTYDHGLGTNHYSFKVDYHSRSPSPLGMPTIPLVSPIPRSPSYHIHTPSPSPPPLGRRIQSPSPPTIISSADQDLINHLQHYVHPGLPLMKNQSDGHLCITTLIKDANGNNSKAKYIQFLLDDSVPCALLTMGQGHPIYAIRLQARPRDGAQSPFHPFRQQIFEHDQPYQHLVNRTLHTLGDPFIEGEVQQFQQLTKVLDEARQEVLDACTEVHQAQHIEMLVSSAFTAAHQAIDASIDQFEQVGAY